jgi:hypothetical protein
MKIQFTLLAFFSSLGLIAQQRDYPYQPVPFTSVKLTDKFWLPRIKINQTVTIPRFL